METISYLFSLWCTLSSNLRIKTAAISAGDFDERPFLQPRFHAFDTAIIQNIDDRSFLEIDHDRSVMRAPSPVPIINSEDANVVVLHRVRRVLFQLAQDRIVTDRHPQPMQQAFGRTTTHAMAHETYDFSHPRRSVRIWWRNRWKLIRESAPPAFAVPALPTQNRQRHLHRAPLDWQICKSTVALTVTMTTSAAAIRADTNRFCFDRNNPVFFILEGHALNFDPWAGRPF